MKTQRFVLLGLLAVMAPGATLAAQGKDDYPSRPVRMIVPFAPGGASDTVARIIQPAMADLLKQQVVVDNRGGAAGNIGVEVAVRANPDGYNFLLGNVGTMAINPVFYTEVSVPAAEGPDPGHADRGRSGLPGRAPVAAREEREGADRPHEGESRASSTTARRRRAARTRSRCTCSSPPPARTPCRSPTRAAPGRR